MKTAVRQLTFLIGEPGPDYIDIAECLSLVNRQLYRQGNVYLVESFTWQHDTGGDCGLISLPTSWTVYQSWKKAKRLWDKMNRQAGVAYPAYHDFKVFFDEVQYQARTGITSNLLPVDGGLNAFSNIGREWVYSQFVQAITTGDPSAPENNVHMLGDDTNVNNVPLVASGSNAIIQMYGDTRVTVGAEEPNLPQDAEDSWAVELFDDGETLHDVAEHLQLHNDEPPYGHALDAQGGDDPIYVGGSVSGSSGHRLATILPMSQETVYAPGGEVPLGLLKVNASVGGKLSINMAPGMYQGIAAMPMGKVQT